MRLTIHLDTFDRLNPMAFVILWLDKEMRQWSREGHHGLDLPRWGAHCRVELHAQSTHSRAARMIRHPSACSKDSI